MTGIPGKTLLASRLVWSDSDGNLRIRMDCGTFTIESDVGQRTARALEVSPEAMDRLVEEWPRLRKSVESG